jgi:hypothetical protein
MKNDRFCSIALATSIAAPLLLAAPAALGQDRPNYDARKLQSKPAAQPRQMYKHVDENGRVVYTDAPKDAAQKGAKLNSSVNVSSPEARRQMQIEDQNNRREEYAERAAAARRYAPIQQREYQDAARKRAEEEALYPEKGPRTVRVVR